MTRYLDRVVERIERLDVLDGVSERAAAALRKVIRPGAVEDTLSGTALTHPVHPMLITLPLGMWTSALLIDAVGGDGETARRLVGTGTLAAFPTAATGASDWLSTAGAERRVGAVHATSNYGAVGLQAASWLARRRGRRPLGVALSTAAMALAAVGGWLGGHLAYALGVGVDTTAFQSLPAEWADAIAVAEIGAGLATCEVDGVPVVVFRAGDELVALADRCTHRGAPLHEGELADGCVTCPWHGSVFAADGTVRSGPATRPQPALEVRVVDERVQVRRSEVRTLRVNPAGR